MNGVTMDEPQNVSIECPQCGTSNAIPRPWELTCQTCKAQLGGGKYSKRAISAWTALFLGVGGTLGASQFFNADRYPMALEHAIIEACINESKRPMTRPSTTDKRDVCICALTETQSEFDADAYDDTATRNKFFDTFEENAKQCISK